MNIPLSLLQSQFWQIYLKPLAERIEAYLARGLLGARHIVFIIFIFCLLLTSINAKGQSNETVKVQKFRFTGNISISTVELQNLVASYLGKEYDLKGLKKIADAVTEEYHRRGFTLTKA